MRLSKIVGMESWITIEASTIQIQSAQLFLSVLIQFLASYNRDKETLEMQREIKNCGFEAENYKAVSASLNASEKMRLRADITQAMPILLSTTIIKLSIGIITVVSAALLRTDTVQLIFIIGFLL